MLEWEILDIDIVADDCFTLGRQAYNEGNFYHTVNWMQEALDRWDYEVNKTVERADILDYLAYAMSMVRI